MQDTLAEIHEKMRVSARYGNVWWR